MNPDFWTGRKVLVTGHTGFKGSWLTLWLQSLGAEVTGYSLERPSDPCLYDLADAGRGISSITADVCNHDELLTVLQAQGCEIVIHMAAQSLVRRSYREPVETYATNVMGTVNVLDAVRNTDTVRVVVIVTSDKCYENSGQRHAYHESDPMGGYDPYSSSKGCAELVTSAWRRSYFNPADHAVHGVAVSSVRAGNVIGGGDWAEDRIIPDVMTAFSHGRHVVLRHPEAVRPWQFVLEPLHGYLLLAEKMWHDGAQYADAWNFGPLDEDIHSVSWLVDELSARWGEGAGRERDDAAHPHEAALLSLDCSHASADLGWRPALELGTALDWITAWYRCFFSAGDVRAVTCDQIRRFQEQLSR